MKKVLSLALALMMVLSLAAVAHAEPIEITYWSVFTGADGATMQGMVDAFNASQDEVHVTHTPMTADDLYQKIPLTVQTGTGIPSVCIVHIERIPNFVNQNMLYSYGEHGRDQIDFYQGGAFNVSYTLSGELERGKLP